MKEFRAAGLLRRGSSVVITNGAGANAEPVALSAVAALLVLHRQMHALMRAQVQGEWLSKAQIAPRSDLRGKTVLVFGFGAIGREVARLCQAFGYTLVYPRFHSKIPRKHHSALCIVLACEAWLFRCYYCE